MSAVAHPPELHPLQGVAACVQAAGEALDRLPTGPLPAGDPDVLESLIEETAREERRLRELRLRLARCAVESRAAEADGFAGTDAWLARLTGSRASVMRGGLWLARMLEERYPQVREAFAAGGLGEAHARIIVQAAEDIPDHVTSADRDAAVGQLVEDAASRRWNTAVLRRRARRMLDVVAASYADEHQAALLAEQERCADNETWLRLDDNGNGTWSGRFTLPDLQAHMLMTRLQHLSSPRRLSRNRAGEQVADETVPSFPGLSWTEALGQAFVELIEHLPDDGLASHGRVGATIAVHVDHDRLRDGLGAAAMDSGGEITAGEARRLACGAGILPMVMGRASVPLDLGRESRLHTKAQRLALSARWDSCAAEGCERPFAWTEIHHPTSWAAGGRADLANALPLCGWHHRRAHDHHFVLSRLASGEVRFRRRGRERPRAPDEVGAAVRGSRG